MLKLITQTNKCPKGQAAAFGRLCVETMLQHLHYLAVMAAAFGRLCVETYLIITLPENLPAAAFGRLCVETYGASIAAIIRYGSRLRAAVC